MNTLKMLGVTLAAMFVLSVPTFAQQNTTQTQTLEELRGIYNELGEIIRQLEGQSAMGSVETEMRLGMLERQAREGVLRGARSDLRALRQQIETGEATEATAEEVERIRADVRRAYMGAGADEMAMAQTIDENLGALSESLIEGRAEAYEDTYGQAISSLEESLMMSREMSDRMMRSQTLAQVRSELQRLQAETVSGADTGAIAEEVEGFREQILQMYEGASEEEMAAAQRIDENLGALTESLVEGRAEAYEDTYGQAIRSLEEGMMSGEMQGDE